MNPQLENKRALVTGGSRGIGAAIVRRLAREGAHVALTYVSKPEQASETAKAAEALGVKAIAIQADSADAKAVVAAVERTAEEWGGIDILVNNAGIGVMAPIDDYRLDDFDRTVAVNLRAVSVATQAAVKHMTVGGRIITIGSCNAERMPFEGGAVYAMSKAALMGLVKGLARDLGPHGITINNVQPGPIDTDMNPADSDFAEMLRQQVMALPRYGTAEEVAAMVAYLAGPEAGFVTGASLRSTEVSPHNGGSTRPRSTALLSVLPLSQSALADLCTNAAIAEFRPLGTFGRRSRGSRRTLHRRLHQESDTL